MSLLLIIWWMMGSAHAVPLADASMRPSAGGAVSLGLPSKTAVKIGSVTLDLTNKATVGMGGRFDYPLHEHFIAGASLSAHGWAAQEDTRSTVIDVSLRPTGRWAVSDAVELNLVLPLGVSLSVLSADAWGEADASLGVHIGLAPMVRFRVADRLLLIGETGYMRRSARHTIFNTKVNARLGELQTSVGVMVEL